ncbi:VOC family protein [Agrobacterium vitis]|uniref:VOC family protein n=1 Tax=Agrobacterium vitis TaxID=373 RepID=UPI0012E88C22|nr:VOC family protein [Agrobacterium vitis]MVA63700.1 VOC family protein [Agrobacterium vitis]
MTQNRPVKRIATVTLVVDDYDRALAFYCGKLGFACTADIDLGDGKRWVVVSPTEDGAGLLLAQADGEKQLAAIGNQAGGRVAFFLETDDFARDHAAFIADGIVFQEEPRYELYGTVAVFEDLYGNLWDLIEPKL